MNYHNQNKTKKFLSAHHREATIALSGLLALIVAFLFPSQTIGETFFLAVLLFLVFPAIVVRFLLKESPGEFGFSIGETKLGAFSVSILVLIFILIEYLLIFQMNLESRFSVSGLTNNFWRFLGLEIGIAIPVYFSYEAFFRGFVQRGLEKKLGGYSLILAAVLQTLTFFKSSWIFIAFVLLASLSAGFIARQTRSVAYSFIFSWIIFVSLDVMLIKSIQEITK